MIAQAILVMMMMLLDTGRCSKPKPMPTSPARCGDLAIPLPFDPSSGCNIDYSLLVLCNDSYHSQPFSYLGNTNFFNISFDKNFTLASSSLASDYYSSWQVNNSTSGATLSKFSMFSRRYFGEHKLIQIPEEQKNMTFGLAVSFRMFSNLPGGNINSSCGYFFKWETMSAFSSQTSKIPVNKVLEWPVPNLSHDVQKSTSSFECRATNSECVDASSGSGYYCKCSTGFEGNPYLVDGCHDIDECLVSEPCEGTCTNLIGSYSCSCPPMFEGDGKIDGSGCHQLSENSHSILYFIYLGFWVPAFGISWIIWFSKQNKVIKLRRDLFVRNGGEVLEAKQSIQKTLAIFTAEDLKKATNNYDERNVLCQEDHRGIIYKGILPGVNGGVTIHNCHAFDGCKIEILISKLVALSQICHRNVVKLLGCCLEIQVPLVVNEFITCKTLLDCINDNSLSWDIRLRIAADTAGALAYLHSATTVSIIHGSLSSSSILLDDAYTVKVNGFALTCSECTSCVQFHSDKPIYFYPDYISCGQLTEKTDVYSFGFILAELLTGKGVMSPQWLQVDENLAKYFVGLSGGGDLLGILDDRLVTDDDIAEKLREVGEIAKRCLSSSSHDRPTMKEVAISLECIIIN